MKRGEVYLINPHPAKGVEPSRIRPAVLVSRQEVLDQASLPVTVVLGQGAENFSDLNPMMVKVEARSSLFRKDTVFCAWQVKSFDRMRFSDPKTGELKYLGTLDAQTLARLDEALLLALDLDRYIPFSDQL